MPNKYQLTFLATFLSTFAGLFLISRYIQSLLVARDIHLRNLILLGLPKDPRHPEMGSHSIQDFVKTFSQEDAIALASSPAFLVTAGLVVATVIYVALFNGPRKPVLKPSEWQEFPLVKITKVSPNTAIYRFALPSPKDVLGLPIGQHISVTAEINGKDIMRSYTPTSSDSDLGHFDLLIKSYEKGNISRYFSLLKLGDKVRVKGPKGNFIYTPTLTSHIGMIAGGTGITPMYQIIRASLSSPTDKTQLSLIYANVNEEDILMREELEDLQKRSGGRFKIYYVLNNPPAGWKGGVGFVTKDQIEHHLPGQEKDCKILMCGPPPMMTAMKKHLEELKYPAPRTVSKLADKVFLF